MAVYSRDTRRPRLCAAVESRGMVIDGHSEGLLQALFLQNPRHHTGRLAPRRKVYSVLGQASRIITKYPTSTFGCLSMDL